MLKLKDQYHTKDLIPEFIAGVEYEIEDIKDYSPKIGDHFYIELDHSLRNNGKEFKTNPLGYIQTLESFEFLHANLKLGKNPFSERTSTHVHVNVGNFTPEQAKNLVLLYALLEPLFFKFVGPERQENIFCVPLNYTYLPNNYNKPLHDLISTWHKYTAFNILPVKEFGTVEFRHLEGTGSYERFKQWIDSLKSLHDFIFFSEFKLMEFLAKGESIPDLARKVVPNFCEGLSNSQMEVLLYDSILDVKLASGGFN